MKKAIKLTLAVALDDGRGIRFTQKFGRINSQEIASWRCPRPRTMQTNLETSAKELKDNIETMNVELNTSCRSTRRTSQHASAMPSGR
ncbi:MAG: hypothetical protein V8Q54_05675 [Alistipes senegalensis]